MPDFYPEGNEVKSADNELRTLHKIAALTGAAAGGVAGTLQGAGVPGTGLGLTGNTYWDSTNKDLYVKDGSTWTLVVDLV